MRTVLAFLTLSIVLPTPTAIAQGMARLMPLQSSYTIGRFQYEPPQGDGWAHVASSHSVFRFIYAEQLGAEAILTRTEIVIESFDIPDPALVADARTLTQLSLNQQAKEREANLVAYSPIESLATEPAVHAFTLVTKTGDKEVFESFFVALAPDKSQYLVGKMTTNEKDFLEAPYYAPLRTSMSALRFEAEASEDPAEKPAEG